MIPQDAGEPRDVPRLCVMLSGTGRTLANLLEAIAHGRLRAKIPLVVASRECVGAERARIHVPHVLVEPGDIPGTRLEAILNAHDIDFVALAGYLRRIEVPASYRGRIVNIHPALLPKFGGRGMYGMEVHKAVLRAGERESGCTVHIVDDEYDHGPVILQRRCPVLAGDTPETLAARVFEEECRAYPEALMMLMGNRGAPGVGWA
jgi:phosphoribosylglycinamide formyltransferase-1